VWVESPLDALAHSPVYGSPIVINVVRDGTLLAIGRQTSERLFACATAVSCWMEARTCVSQEGQACHG